MSDGGKILTRKLLPWQKHQEQRNSYSLNFLDAKVIIYSDLNKLYSPKNAFFLKFLKKKLFLLRITHCISKYKSYID